MLTYARRSNRLKEARAQGREVTGVYVQSTSEDSVEIAAIAGYDYVILDSQHGASGFDALVRQILAAEAAGITPLVRVPSHEPTHIMRLLDVGAMGIIVPAMPFEASITILSLERLSHSSERSRNWRTWRE